MSEEQSLTYDACSKWLERTDYNFEFDQFIQSAEDLSFSDTLDIEMLCPLFWSAFLDPRQDRWDSFNVRLAVLAFLQHHDVAIPDEHHRCFLPVWENAKESYEAMIAHGTIPKPPTIDLSFKGERRGFYEVDWQDKYMEDWYAAYLSTLRGCIYDDDSTAQELTGGIREYEEIEVYDCVGQAYFFAWLETYQYDVGVEVFDKSPWLYFRDHETQELQDIYFSTFLSRLSRPE